MARNQSGSALALRVQNWTAQSHIAWKVRTTRDACGTRCVSRARTVPLSIRRLVPSRPFIEIKPNRAGGKPIVDTPSAHRLLPQPVSDAARKSARSQRSPAIEPDRKLPIRIRVMIKAVAEECVMQRVLRQSVKVIPVEGGFTLEDAQTGFITEPDLRRQRTCGSVRAGSA